MTKHLVLICLALLAGIAGAVAQPLAEVPLPTRNYVNNGGFERGLEGWEAFGGRTCAVATTDEKHSGSACLKVTGMLDDYRYLNQAPVLLVPGQTYTLSAWMKCSGFKRAGENSLVLNLTNYGWTKSAQLGPLQPDQGWTRYTVTFEAPPTSEANGRPSYTLIVFWPIKSEGTVWIDDIQIEAAPQASDFTDSFLGWAIEAREMLGRTQARAAATRQVLAEGLGEVQVPAGCVARSEQASRQVQALADKLRQYAALPYAEAKALPEQVAALDRELIALSTLAFLSNPYLPLREISLPAEDAPALDVNWTCLQGEQRAVALNMMNLGRQTSVMRLVAGDLWDETRGVRCPGVPWLKTYAVPPLRGHLKPWERFTDPLPELDSAGTWTLGGGQLNQAVLVGDTSHLAPGTYRGEVVVTSMTEPAAARKVSVTLKVVPVALSALGRPEVCDIGQLADYALDSIEPLGLNTFTVPAQWLVPEYDATGTGALRVDLARIAPLVKSRLRRCPRGQFWLGFGVGAIVSDHLKRVYQLEPADPRWAKYITNWTHAVVAGFRTLGVTPDRLILETVDEPGAGQLAEAVALAKAIKAAEPAVRTHSYVTSFNADDPDCRKLYESHDIIAPGFTSINEGSVGALRKLGKQVWVYDCQNSGETFHPVSYYRLLPWLAWRHGLDGWGHFSMLNSERGRNYEPWEGVAEESLVYPAGPDSQVISRRWLALEAGTEDYRALQTLTRLANAAEKAKFAPQAVAQARKLLQETPAQALALAKPGREYFTGLQAGADPALLDRAREQAATLAGELAAALPTVRVAAALGKDLIVTLPAPAEVTVRYLCDHALPWQTMNGSLPAGRAVFAVPGPRVTRCLVTVTGADGRVTTVSPLPLPRITVDSTIPPYTAERLNDGLAMPGMKFEPEHGWISGGSATDHWLEARLDQPLKLRGVKVWWMTFYGPPQAIKVQLWQQGAWRDAPGYEQWRPAKASVEELTFPPVTTDRVRVVQQAGGGNRTFANLMGASEVVVLPAVGP